MDAAVPAAEGLVHKTCEGATGSIEAVLRECVIDEREVGVFHPSVFRVVGGWVGIQPTPGVSVCLQTLKLCRASLPFI